VRKRDCFQVKASFRVFRYSTLCARPEDEKRQSAAGYCASHAAIIVHGFTKQAGSFIPLHLETAGTAEFRR
jgi:hypothetical protein